MGAGGMAVWLVVLLSWYFRGCRAVRSAGLARRDVLRDGPGEAEHLAGDGGAHHRGRLAGGDQPAVLQYQLGTLEKDLKSAEDAWEALLEEYEQGAA